MIPLHLNLKIIEQRQMSRLDLRAKNKTGKTMTFSPYLKHHNVKPCNNLKTRHSCEYQLKCVLLISGEHGGLSIYYYLHTMCNKACKYTKLIGENINTIKHIPP